MGKKTSGVWDLGDGRIISVDVGGGDFQTEMEAQFNPDGSITVLDIRQDPPRPVDDNQEPKA